MPRFSECFSLYCLNVINAVLNIEFLADGSIVRLLLQYFVRATLYSLVKQFFRFCSLATLGTTG